MLHLLRVQEPWQAEAEQAAVDLGYLLNCAEGAAGQGLVTAPS